MTVKVTRRRAAVCITALAGLLGVVGFRTMPGAEAQEPVIFTDVIEFSVSGISNGNTSNPELGQDDDILGISCAGAAPRGGTPALPAMVITELTATDTRLRVIQSNGVALNGNVRINCTIMYLATPEAAARTEQQLGETDFR